MDTKLMFPGGEPDMVEEDFMRMQLSNRDFIQESLGDFSFDFNFIISGCVPTLTSSQITVTEGYIMLRGDILKVDAHTVLDTEGDNRYKYKKVTTYESGGDKTYVNGVSHQTWKKERGVLESTKNTLNTNFNLLFWLAPRFFESDSHLISIINGFNGKIELKYIAGAQLQIRGKIRRDSSSGAGHGVFTAKVPEEYSSVSDFKMIATSSTGKTALIIFNRWAMFSGATFEIDDDITYSDGYLYFDGICNVKRLSSI